MALIINNPPRAGGEGERSAMLVVGVLIAMVVLAGFILFGLPVIQKETANTAETGSNITIEIPAVEATEIQ